MTSLSIAAAFPPVDQQYLLQARQMQALSFAVHIPLVAFGISFPAMILFVEWLGHRRGDEHRFGGEARIRGVACE